MEGSLLQDGWDCSRSSKTQLQSEPFLNRALTGQSSCPNLIPSSNIPWSPAVVFLGILNPSNHPCGCGQWESNLGFGIIAQKDFPWFSHVCVPWVEKGMGTFPELLLSLCPALGLERPERSRILPEFLAFRFFFFFACLVFYVIFLGVFFCSITIAEN